MIINMLLQSIHKNERGDNVRKVKRILKSCIATALLCAVAGTSIPQYAANAAGEIEKGLVLYYDFESLKSGTIVNDVSGNGQNGVVRPAGSGVEIETASILGEQYTAFVMNGGQPDETHTYVEMPQGILNGLEDVTISCWVYVDDLSTGYQRIWDLGSDTTSYMYLLINGYNEGHVGYTGAITGSGWSDEKGPQKGEALEAGKWILTTLTFDGSEKEMSVYEDAKLIGTEKTDVDLSVLENSTQNWIGYGMFKNEILSGKIADFKIYNYALTAEEVAASFNISDEERVKRDKAALSLGGLSAVTSDISLPIKGEAGSDITWASSDESIVKANGTVTRPEAGMGDAEIVLTATITSNDYSETKEFKVVVKQNLTAEEIVANDILGLDLGNLSAVAENLVLPVKGEFGSTIEWKTSDKNVIAKDGVVVRPIGEAETVTLTATVSYKNVSEEAEFVVTVVPKYEKKDIVLVEEILVESAVGTLPNLPNEVYVVYEDDTTGMEKVIWPTDLSVRDFGKTGTYTVKGSIVDTDKDVTAAVNVVEKIAAPEKAAESFELSEIILEDGDTIYNENNERALEYLKIMDADRMLYNFRATFGQSTKGAAALTGWDEPSGLLRGHSTGHFLSALAQAYASTGDDEYKEKMDYMIAEMRKLQLLSKGNAEDFETVCTPSSAAQSAWSTDPSTWGEGFISAYSPDQFALLEQYTPYATIWAPYYTLHKLMAGFIDCYNYGGNEEALEIAKDLGTWVYRRLNACTQEQRETMWSMYIAGEYGGMNESLARLYEITSEETYLEAAKMFDNADFFDGLANNVDTIQDRHANQHIPQIVGAIHEYAATGDEYYYNVAKNFWEMVVGRYAYSIGGVGTGERFKNPYEQGANILGNAGRGENCETCAAYNMLKLTMELHNYDPDNAAYMDYYERTLINQIAASQSHDTTSYMHNGVTYMLPVDPGQLKSYDSDYGGFTCCNGTGMENHVKYQAAAYTHNEDTLYVNLYMPTTVNWEEKNVSVTQETNFPSEYSKLTVDGSGKFSMKLRVPYWATEGFKVSVNGEIVIENPEVSTYVELSREWKSGDVVEIEMPYTLHLDKTPDKVDGDTVASLMYGPLVMVAKDDRDTYVPMNWYKVVLGDDLTETVEVVTGADEDEAPHLQTNGLHFYPMYDAYNYRYHAYVKVEETVSVLNTVHLEELIASVTGDNALNEEEYSEEEWDSFEDALNKAEDVLASTDKDQADVYEAYKNLQTILDEMNKGGTSGILGDVNGDEVVDTSDAQAIFNHFMGIVLIEDSELLELADVNGDDKVDTSDAQKVFNMFMGIA